MQSNRWIWIAGVIVILAGVGLWFVSSQPAATVDEGASSNVTGGEQVATSTGTGSNTGTNSGGDTPAAGTYTAAQVATHNSASSCWSIIDGNVYDLTNWIGKHPGGAAAIQQLCGKDGTATFHGQHGNAQQQATVLATFKIGVLAK